MTIVGNLRSGCALRRAGRLLEARAGGGGNAQPTPDPIARPKANRRSAARRPTAIPRIPPDPPAAFPSGPREAPPDDTMAQKPALFYRASPCLRSLGFGQGRSSCERRSGEG